MGKILVVDDEVDILSAIQKMLTLEGHEIVTARKAETALESLEETNPDVVVIDIRLPGMSGIDAFQRMRRLRPKLPVVVMTGYGTTDSAIEATKLGAFEYVIKPFRPKALLSIIASALECVRLMRGDVALARMPELPVDDAIIGDTPVMQEVYKSIGRVAQTDATVLIRGETGTGKELVARALYQHSLRNRMPLLLINCAAVPEALLESEFFGHERGAFTGAASRRIGKFEQAMGGTVFLDEIGEIPIGIQVKILRVLQERRFERVGGNETIESDIRVIAATNRNLERAIAEGRFREDLYHRLDVVTIYVPPLRERRDDIPRLTNYFIGRFARRLGMERPVLTEEALDVLRGQAWPGNVRELEHCVHRAIIFSRGYPITADNIRRALERQSDEEEQRPDPGSREESGARHEPGTRAESTREEAALRSVVREYLDAHASGFSFQEFVDLTERLLLIEALRRTGGNLTRAAQLLGLARPTFQTKMQRLQISRDSLYKED
jgi:DNA-binding NtrC family response regulator